MTKIIFLQKKKKHVLYATWKELPLQSLTEKDC